MTNYSGTSVQLISSCFALCVWRSYLVCGHLRSGIFPNLAMEGLGNPTTIRCGTPILAQDGVGWVVLRSASGTGEVDVWPRSQGSSLTLERTLFCVARFHIPTSRSRVRRALCHPPGAVDFLPPARGADPSTFLNTALGSQESARGGK